MNMSDEKETSSTESLSAGMPAAPRVVDPRPTDLQVFFMLLPGVLGGLAAKSADIRSTNSTAFVMVRQALGQCAAMGTLRASFICLDGSFLASMPSDQVPMGVQGSVSQQQTSGNGVVVGQHPNQPGYGQANNQAGVGGMVSQYPNQPAPYAGNQQPNFGGGSRGVMVAQFPNGTTPPQL
jgi:hypothetical protein